MFHSVRAPISKDTKAQLSAPYWLVETRLSAPYWLVETRLSALHFAIGWGNRCSCCHIIGMPNTPALGNPHYPRDILVRAARAVGTVWGEGGRRETGSFRNSPSSNHACEDGRFIAFHRMFAYASCASRVLRARVHLPSPSPCTHTHGEQTRA